MDYWDSPPMDRKQILLFSPTLDATIPEDHPVRLFDEMLSRVDWAPWEARYLHRMGRPPIPPRVMAAVVLYGLSAGIRSSRRLEEACLARIDFLWLASGRPIDHATICDFRTAFAKELKGAFREIGRVAMAMGLMRLNRIGLDGTRERANSSRHAMASAQTLQERLAALDAQIEAAFAEAEAEERRDVDLFGSATPNKLPASLAKMERRRECMQKAFEKAQALDAQRPSAEEPPAQGEDKPRPAKVPVADPDSAMMPNKDGGYAPNYTPLLAMDDRGYIADADVDNRPTEGDATVATVDRIEEAFGQRPKEVVADGAYSDGAQMAGLEARDVQAYIPVVTAQGDAADNPALRADPTRAVPPEAWDRLPRSRKGKRRETLDRSAFVYDQAKDCFYCPMGRTLERQGPQNRTRANGQTVVVYRYQCVSCKDCPLGAACRQSDSPRIVQVDEYEPVRQQVSLATKSTAGREAAKRRSWICETPFAFIKTWMNFRQFLTRGLEKVKTEWLWTCAAYNLRKLVADVQRMRVKFATLLA